MLHSRWTIGALCLVLALVSGATLTADEGFAIDFNAFWRAASGLPAAPNTPYVNPPTAMILFRPLVAGGFWFWTVINAAVFYVGLRQLIGAKWVVLAMFSPVYFVATWLGQSTPLLTGLAALAMVMPPVWGGMLLGLVAVTKPQLVWLLPLILLNDRTRLTAMIGSAAVLVFGSLALDPDAWVAWLRSMDGFRSLLIERLILLHSPSPSALAQFAGPGWAAMMFCATLALCVVVLLRAGNFPIAIAACAFAAPYAMPQDLVGVLPFAAAAIVGGRSLWVRAAGAATFTGLLLPVSLCALLVERIRLSGAAQRSAMPSAVG